MLPGCFGHGCPERTGAVSAGLWGAPCPLRRGLEAHWEMCRRSGVRSQSGNEGPARDWVIDLLKRLSLYRAVAVSMAPGATLQPASAAPIFVDECQFCQQGGPAWRPQRVLCVAASRRRRLSFSGAADRIQRQY